MIKKNKDIDFVVLQKIFDQKIAQSILSQEAFVAKEEIMRLSNTEEIASFLNLSHQEVMNKINQLAKISSYPLFVITELRPTASVSPIVAERIVNELSPSHLVGYIELDILMVGALGEYIENERKDRSHEKSMEEAWCLLNKYLARIKECVHKLIEFKEDGYKGVIPPHFMKMLNEIEALGCIADIKRKWILEIR